MIVISIFSLAMTMSAQTQKTQNRVPDNTQVNQRDRDNNNPTADQQKGRSDDEITRQIRRSITKDKAMSTYAKNVKIITQNGNVTLRGPVRTDEEKRSVEEKANDVAGREHVKNEIQIAPQDTKRKQ
jgi:hyperosmotically inducible protein